jgi:hydroxypyruvate isomerase
MSTRRHFIKTTSFAGISPFVINPFSFSGSSKPLRASLNPSSVVLKCDAQELLDYAISYDFSAISPPLNELLKLKPNEKKAYLKKMLSNEIVFDSGGLPVEFRSSEEVFQQGLKTLQQNIKAIASFNISSLVTWIMPTHDSLTYNKNFELHRVRLGKIASVLSYEGVQLGLEYVGPKTLMVTNKYPFLHSISELRELINAIDKDNIGYLLDSFHTYCAGDQIEDMNFLNVKDIISVQINDAVVNRTADTQIDWERELPGETGIIDLKKFLDFIRSKGYEGAVSVEPFNENINLMEAPTKLKKIRASLLKNGI